MRLDKGTETGHMATIHACLREGQKDVENNELEVADTVQYGPSTNNKVLPNYYLGGGGCSPEILKMTPKRYQL